MIRKFLHLFYCCWEEKLVCDHNVWTIFGNLKSVTYKVKTCSYCGKSYSTFYDYGDKT